MRKPQAANNMCPPTGFFGNNRLKYWGGTYILYNYFLLILYFYCYRVLCYHFTGGTPSTVPGRVLVFIVSATPTRRHTVSAVLLSVFSSTRIKLSREILLFINYFYTFVYCFIHRNFT